MRSDPEYWSIVWYGKAGLDCKKAYTKEKAQELVRFLHYERGIPLKDISVTEVRLHYLEVTEQFMEV